MKQLYYLLFFSLIGLSSCEIINPDEEIPAFIHIKNFEIITDIFDQGSNSSAVTDVWVFLGTEFLGAFELPVTIPVLASGTQEIRLSAGIKDNGIRALPEIYLMYEDFTQTVDLAPNQVDTIQPRTTYLSNLNFLFQPQEGFESSTLQIGEDLDDNPETIVVRTEDEVFEGDFSGHIRLTNDNPSIEIGSIRLPNVPFSTGAKIYMELDYKTDVPFLFGILGYDEQGNRIFVDFDKGVNVKEDWNKIYLNFTEEMLDVSARDNIAFYQFCLHSQLGEEMNEGNIYLDNIKWITF